MAYLLDSEVPACDEALDVTLDPFFKIFRDDGLGITFADPKIVADILEFFNGFNSHIQWTIPSCRICDVAEVTCHHYTHLEFLDCDISWKQVSKGDILIWQFCVKSYAKTTDCHAYLSPNSCSSPHLNSKGVSVAKTVGTRLRTIHNNDEDLLHHLNLYCGYMVARGYDENSVKFHLSNMANRSREMLLNGDYRPAQNFILPLVTSLHPATTVISRLAKSAIQEATSMDPILPYLFPKSSLCVAFTKLPNLQILLCKNDQNSLVSTVPTPPANGYIRTSCKCLVCQASKFSKFVQPPSLPGYAVKLSQTVTCKSGPTIIYHLVCMSKRPECKYAHYVGRAHTSDPSKSAMGLRWSNHKSHHKHGYNNCKMTDHLMSFHKGEDPQKFVKIQILESLPDQENVIERELWWQRKLFAFQPTGLCVREESNE